jgi:hypothetical protein
MFEMMPEAGDPEAEKLMNFSLIGNKLDWEFTDARNRVKLRVIKRQDRKLKK